MFLNCLRIKPCELVDANKFIEAHHRHHKRVQGHRYSLAAWMNGTCVGVVCVGRPVARMTDCRRILEVTRLCSDGTKNVCSALYAAASRVGKEMGYEKIQTFILASEPGTSLKATGWVRSHDSAGGVWGRPSRGRRVTAPTDPKVCWTRDLNPSDRISDYL